jgi:hypothetical protein
MTYINAVQIVCNKTLADMAGIDLRATHAFRFVIDNGATTLVDPMIALGTMYAESSVKEAQKIQSFLYGFYPATCFLAVLVVRPRPSKLPDFLTFSPFRFICRPF